MDVNATLIGDSVVLIEDDAIWAELFLVITLPCERHNIVGCGEVQLFRIAARVYEQKREVAALKGLRLAVGGDCP